MLPIVSHLNFLLALCAIALEIGTLALIAACIYQWRTKTVTMLGRFADRFAMPLALVLALAGTIMPLVYSEGFGFVPCSLCWFQRAALYPQVAIAAAALCMRDRAYAPAYLIILSALGALAALYQHYLQMGGSAIGACPASLGDCAQRILFEFNYITFPLVAFSLFAFVIALFALALCSRAPETARLPL
jgi:disulfide bond formation protein DsbB